MTAVDPTTTASPSPVAGSATADHAVPASAHTAPEHTAPEHTAPEHTAPEHTAPEATGDRFASPVPVANAALIGLPSFIVGSVALALVLTGFVPQTLAGAPIAIIALATGIGQLTAMVFALKAGESAVGGVFGIFSGFWLSYAALVLGILHNWYALTVAPTGSSAAAVATATQATGANILGAQKVFLLSWIILVSLLTLVSLRLPSAFTVLFVLVDLSLLFVYLGTVNASTGETRTGGWFAWAFIAVGAYLFLDAMTAATGGKNLPLGRAVIK